MSTAELKQNIMNLLQSTEDESKLMVIYNALQVDEKDWYETLTDDQKASIERGSQDLSNARVTPHKEAMTELKNFISSHA